MSEKVITVMTDCLTLTVFNVNTDSMKGHQEKQITYTQTHTHTQSESTSSLLEVKGRFDIKSQTSSSSPGVRT